MASVGAASSLTIVPWPWLSLMVALVAPRQVDEEGLVELEVVSPLTLTVIVLVVSPAAKMSVPRGGLVIDPGGARRAALAVPGAVAQLTLAGSSVAPVLVTVKVKAVVPLLPSSARRR